MDFRLFITVLLIAMTLMSCEKEKGVTPSNTTTATTTTETRNLDLQPVGISVKRAGDTIGYGTWVSKNTPEEYLISARHVFGENREYYIAYSIDGKTFRYRPVVKIDDKNTELCLCVLGAEDSPAPKLSTKQSSTSVEIERKIRGGLEINLSLKPEVGVYTSVVGTAGFDSVAIWIGLPEDVQALDCYLGHGSSGTGFFNRNQSDRFWVILGGWPEILVPQMKHLSQQKNPKGFTTICGLTWSQIEEARKSLFGK